MKKEELRQKLLHSITDSEWRRLERRDSTLHIGGFNREVLLRMREDRDCPEGDVPDQTVTGLSDALKAYLGQYMADCPEGRKWVILSCLYLACVKGVPLHPQETTRWTMCENGYVCPSHSGRNSICGYCICRESAKDETT